MCNLLANVFVSLLYSGTVQFTQQSLQYRTMKSLAHECYHLSRSLLFFSKSKVFLEPLNMNHNIEDDLG